MKTIRTLLVSAPFLDHHKARLEAILPDTEIIYAPFMKASEEDVKKADVIFGNVKQSYLPQCSKLQWVHLATAGTDGYIPVLPEGVMLTNSTGSYGPAIGEYMIGMLLALQKKLHLYLRNQDRHHWHPEGRVTGIVGSTCLVIGLGDLGKNFAWRIKALGGHVIGVRRAGLEKPDYVDELYLTEQLDQLLPRADIVAMCLPATAATDKIMSRERLALMKPGAYLLNTGRGSAIDQEALIEALNSGHLAGAALDVAVPEPLPEDHPLWSAKNILITPHTTGGWNLDSTLEIVVNIFMDNLQAWLHGHALKNQVDLSTGYTRSEK